MCGEVKDGMKDTIYRQDAINAMREYAMGGLFYYYRAVIEKLSSAEPGLIRCKECKYWDESSVLDGLRFRYYSFCGFLNIHTDETDYCSFAERREDGYLN